MSYLQLLGWLALRRQAGRRQARRTPAGPVLNAQYPSTLVTWTWAGVNPTMWSLFYTIDQVLPFPTSNPGNTPAGRWYWQGDYSGTLRQANPPQYLCWYCIVGDTGGVFTPWSLASLKMPE